MTKVMVLAAGRGSRLKELTEHTPKPLVSVGKVQPLKRTLSLLAHRGFTQVVVNAWYLAEKIKKAVEPIKNPAVTVVEEDYLLDTGGGVKNALSHLGIEPFIVINGDLIWSEETDPILAQLPDLFDAEKMDVLLLLIPRLNALGYSKTGDFSMTENGQIAFKGKDQNTAPYVYSGIQILHPRVFAAHDKNTFSIIDVYRTVQQKGRLYGHVYTGEWADMGTPEGIWAATELLTRLKTENLV